MKRISKLNRGSELIKHLMATMVILASLLILPNTYARVGDIFTQDKIQYTVTSEGALYKSVSVTGYETGIVTADIPVSVTHNEKTYDVTVIDEYAFYECSSLTSIEIPESILKISYRAFINCNELTYIFIPKSVSYISQEAFYAMGKLQCIEVDSSNEFYISQDGVLFDKEKTILIRYPQMKPNVSYGIPNTVKTVGLFSFFGCSILRDIEIPNSVTKIEDWAFTCCYDLQSMSIPASVKDIGGATFTFCRSFNSIEFLGDAPRHGDITFGEGDSLAPVTVYYIEGTSGWTNPWCGRPTVAVSTAPTIIAQPSDRTVTEGGSAQFSVGVIGTTSFNYQWYKDGRAINGATSDSYRIDEVDRSDAGNYFVIVSNEYGTATSEVALLTVNEGAAPEITVQPINKKVKVGTNTGFSVQASNATGYQWYKNGVAIEEATSRFLELNNVSKEDEGEYFAVASNKSGTAASKVVTLTVMIPPVIIKQPESLSVLEGTEAALSVEAENATGYQWYKDNTIINGATNAVYAITATVKDDSGVYYVNVMHQDLVVKSKEARLEVYSLPVITQQPESLSVLGGESATFTVKAENVTECQWYKDGTAISGANQETYTIEAVKGYDVGEYSVVVGNIHTKLASDVVTLGISEPYRATAEVQIANGY
ncbi:MAG: immunoglobulin domain-containing protein, partial [Verrucomicrobia bacterium]|nr:immunoglobulin domain-containing protein [Verrucomicrobiota bacterium]